MQEKLGQLNTVLQEDLAGLRVVRSFAREDYEAARYQRVNGELLERNLTTVRAQSNNFPLVFFFANLGTLSVILFGGFEVISGDLSIGVLIAFNSYLAFLLQPILTIGFLSASISRAGASLRRIFEVQDTPLEVEDRPDAIPLPPVRCRVEFKDVSLRYPATERDILDGVSFCAEPGQTVALVGPTGAGKTTIANLIPRFYDVTGGVVKVDDHDVRRVTRKSLRRGIAAVLQEPFLFSGTIAENIAYGRDEASREEVERAARAVSAHDFIADLPEGYDTALGEGGGVLSQGQRQLLSFARAVLADPRILILDEATSNIDTRTEALIQNALSTLLEGRTSVVIAHRLSTIRNADLILAVEDGRVAERGTHAELLQRDGLYADLYRRQFRDTAARNR